MTFPPPPQENPVQGNMPKFARRRFRNTTSTPCNCGNPARVPDHIAQKIGR